MVRLKKLTGVLGLFFSLINILNIDLVPSAFGNYIDCATSGYTTCNVYYTAFVNSRIGTCMSNSMELCKPNDMSDCNGICLWGRAMGNTTTPNGDPCTTTSGGSGSCSCGAISSLGYNNAVCNPSASTIQTLSFTFTPNAADLGTSSINTATTPITVTVKNTSAYPASNCSYTFSSTLSSSSNWVLTNQCSSIAAGGSCTLSLAGKPQGSGTFDTNITIQCGAVASTRTTLDEIYALIRKSKTQIIGGSRKVVDAVIPSAQAVTYPMSCCNSIWASAENVTDSSCWAPVGSCASIATGSCNSTDCSQVNCQINSARSNDTACGYSGPGGGGGSTASGSATSGTYTVHGAPASVPSTCDENTTPPSGYTVSCTWENASMGCFCGQTMNQTASCASVLSGLSGNICKCDPDPNTTRHFRDCQICPTGQTPQYFQGANTNDQGLSMSGSWGSCAVSGGGTPTPTPASQTPTPSPTPSCLITGGVGRLCTQPSDCCSGYTCSLVGAQPLSIYSGCSNSSCKVGVNWVNNYSGSPETDLTGIGVVGGSNVPSYTGSLKMCLDPSRAVPDQNFNFLPLPSAATNVDKSIITFDATGFQCALSATDKHRYKVGGIPVGCSCQNTSNGSTINYSPMVMSQDDYSKIAYEINLGNPVLDKLWADIIFSLERHPEIRRAVAEVSETAGNSIVEAKAIPPTGLSFTFTPNTYDFGSVAVGATSAAQSITIKNTSTTDAHTCVVGISNSTDFAWTDTGACSDILAGASCTMPLKGRPQNTGVRTATLEIDCGNISQKGSVNLDRLFAKLRAGIHANADRVVDHLFPDAGACTAPPATMPGDNACFDSLDCGGHDSSWTGTLPACCCTYTWNACNYVSRDACVCAQFPNSAGCSGSAPGASGTATSGTYTVTGSGGGCDAYVGQNYTIVTQSSDLNGCGVPAPITCSEPDGNCTGAIGMMGFLASPGKVKIFVNSGGASYHQATGDCACVAAPTFCAEACKAGTASNICGARTADLTVQSCTTTTAPTPAPTPNPCGGTMAAGTGVPEGGTCNDAAYCPTCAGIQHQVNFDYLCQVGFQCMGMGSPPNNLYGGTGTCQACNSGGSCTAPSLGCPGTKVWNQATCGCIPGPTPTPNPAPIATPVPIYTDGGNAWANGMNPAVVSNQNYGSVANAVVTGQVVGCARDCPSGQSHPGMDPNTCTCPTGQSFDSASWTCVACPTGSTIVNGQCKCPFGWENYMGACRPKLPSAEYIHSISAPSGYPICSSGNGNQNQRLPTSYTSYPLSSAASSSLPLDVGPAVITTSSGNQSYDYSNPLINPSNGSMYPGYAYADLNHCACSGHPLTGTNFNAPPTKNPNQFSPDTFDAISSFNSNGLPNKVYGMVAMTVGGTMSDPRAGDSFRNNLSSCGCPNLNEVPIVTNAGVVCKPAFDDVNRVFTTFNPAADDAPGGVTQVYTRAVVSVGGGISGGYTEPVNATGVVQTIQIPSNPAAPNALANYARHIWKCQIGYSLDISQTPPVCKMDETKQKCDANSPMPLDPKTNAPSGFGTVINKKLACCMNNKNAATISSADVKFDCVDNNYQNSGTFDALWKSSDDEADGGEMAGMILASGNGKPLTGFYTLTGARCNEFSEFDPAGIQPGKINPVAAGSATQQNNTNGATGDGQFESHGSRILPPSGTGYTSLQGGFSGAGKALVAPQPSAGNTAENAKARRCPILVRAAMVASCPPVSKAVNAVHNTVIDSRGHARCPAADSVQVHIRAEQVFEIAGQPMMQPVDTVVDRKSASAVSMEQIIRKKNGSGCLPGMTSGIGGCHY